MHRFRGGEGAWWPAFEALAALLVSTALEAMVTLQYVAHLNLDDQDVICKLADRLTDLPI